MSSKVKWKATGRTGSALYIQFRNKYGFCPTEERCGDCSSARKFHFPGGIEHEFVSTRQSVNDPSPT